MNGQKRSRYHPVLSAIMNEWMKGFTTDRESSCIALQLVSTSSSHWYAHTSDAWWLPWGPATADCHAWSTWEHNQETPCHLVDFVLPFTHAVHHTCVISDSSSNITPYRTAGRLLIEAKFVCQRWNSLILKVMWCWKRMNVKNLSG